MDDSAQANITHELFDSSHLNPQITSAVQRIKSFSPGEVYEFLQNRFPLQTLKSKAHAKTASALISVLHKILDDADLEKAEISQIKLYEKTLQSFIAEHEAALAREIAAGPEAKAPPARKRFADTLIGRLKESAEAERKSIFGGVSKAKKDAQIVEAKFRKVKSR